MYYNNLKLLNSKISGQGVFTTIKIPAHSPVIEITGNLYTKENLLNNLVVLQIGHNLFIGPSGGLDDYINHSCDPNCSLHIVGSRAILYSLYVIQPLTEITFDYSTSSTDDKNAWSMDCKCRSINCRKVISGLKYLDKNFIESYNKRGMIPLFMKEKIFR